MTMPQNQHQNPNQERLTLVVQIDREKRLVRVDVRREDGTLVASRLARSQTEWIDLLLYDFADLIEPWGAQSP